MKKLLASTLMVLALIMYKPSQAQVSVQINIGDQPEWGPTGYDHVDYYYLPDYDIYYYVPKHQFVYSDNGRWKFSTSLPSRYRSFDFYNAHKVVINEPAPYLNHDKYKVKYASFKGKRDQQTIRDSHEDRYKDHWKKTGRKQPQPPHDNDRNGRGDNRGHH